MRRISSGPIKPSWSASKARKVARMSESSSEMSACDSAEDTIEVNVPNDTLPLSAGGGGDNAIGA